MAEDLDLWGGMVVIRGSFVRSRTYHPPTDLYETEDEYVVLVAVSRADPESFRITYDGRYLVIRGVRPEPQPGVPKKYHLLEIPCGAFERQIPLVADIDPEGIRSTYRDGMLEIRLPKRKPRIITPEG